MRDSRINDASGREVAISHGLHGPAGMPPALVKSINHIVNNALRDPTVASRIRQVGGNVECGGSTGSLNGIEEERAIWGRVIKALNLNLAP